MTKDTRGNIARYDAAKDAEKAAERDTIGLGADTAAEELRRLTLVLWQARAARAEIAATAKEKAVRVSLIALYLAVVVLALTAAGQFLPSPP